MPEKYSIVSGFVVKQTDVRGQHEPSKQLDIIVYDNSFPTLFKEGDFAIVTPDSVKAIIEVKANLQKQKNKKDEDERVIVKANNNGKFIYDGKHNIWNKQYGSSVSREEFEFRNRFFNGIFSFEGFEKSTYDFIKKYIKSESSQFSRVEGFDMFCVNHISFNKDTFYKYWQGVYYSSEQEYKNYIYDIKDLSFSYFISNLIDYVSDSVISNSNLWYPIDKSFEVKETFNFND